MKKSELRKIIRETIKEQFTGNLAGLTPGSAQYCSQIYLDNFNQTQSGYYTNQLVNAVWYGCSSGNWGGQPGGGQGFGTEEFYNGYFNTIVQEQGASSVTEAQANACSCFPSTPPVDTLGPAPGPGQTMGMPSPATSPVKTPKKPIRR